MFSKQKGLTLVFRNDPLESLKVSSTFDSIPFVRDYLQRTIESQLRTLLMDEAPAIIHRLSLRLWAPEYRANGYNDNLQPTDTVTDPLVSPPQDAVDMNGQIVDASQIASLSLDSQAQALFSHKNLIKLATLSDSQRTLSLFTPSMQNVVYRAWSGSSERTGMFSPALSRTNSILVNSNGTNDMLSDDGSYSTRPSLYRLGSSFGGSAISSKTGKPRKRKHRIVNLRKSSLNDDSTSISGDSATISSSTSEAGFSVPIQEERDVELVTPPMSPQTRRHNLHNTPENLPELTPRPQKTETTPFDSFLLQETAEFEETPKQSVHHERPKAQPNRYFSSFSPPNESFTSRTQSESQSHGPPYLASPFPYLESHPGGILEQAWMMKMAGEIARRIQEQELEQRSKHSEARSSRAAFWNDNDAPPAYGS